MLAGENALKLPTSSTSDSPPSIAGDVRPWSASAVARTMYSCSGEVVLTGMTAADYLNQVLQNSADWLGANHERVPWSEHSIPALDALSEDDVLIAIAFWQPHGYDELDIQFAKAIFDSEWDTVTGVCGIADSSDSDSLSSDSELLATLGLNGAAGLKAVEQWGEFDRFIAYTFIELVCRTLDHLTRVAPHV